MKKGLNGFPLDNAMSTQIKYDLFVEKMNYAQRSYDNRNPSNSNLSILLGVFQIIFGLVMLIVSLAILIFKTLKNH